ncbi:MAG TPA: TonB-dependent receptor [Bryobacteraceae bacterium]|nr:TonB-dependent receptor [Bryobacteraceae bacterium]
MNRILFATLALSTLPLAAQRGTGELRLTVRDPAGLGLEASGSFVGQSAQVRRVFATDPQGRYSLRALPFGVYRMRVDHPGFAPFSSLVEVRTEAPVDYRVTLGLTAVETTVQVSDFDTLLDPHRTGALNYLGAETLRDRRAAPPGRAVLELIDTQPGWLLEANGVLHPRGAEYGVQYVVDGVPVFDNRSPAYAPALEVEDVQSMNVLTGNYPAEFGRKLGGVIDVVTARNTSPGFHGKAAFQAARFSTASGFFSGQYTFGRTTAAAGFEALHTGRYLDPPAERNYTNKASGGGATVRLERDFSDKDRLSLHAQRKRVSFLVPNETLQELAGQRQDRSSEETEGRLSYQRVFSPGLLGAVRAMSRDVSAALWSNPLSTPILPAQDRGFRESYLRASVSGHRGAHEWKAGADAIFSSIHESFSYRITAFRIGALRVFDRDTPPNFRFSDRRQDREQSAFVQDLIRKGNFTFSAGLRWDHYRLLVDENAVSPRLGAAWHLPSAGLLLRASYDRAFQTPAMENLLLAASDAAHQLSDAGLSLPVRPSRGNFYEAGFSKTLLGKLRLDGAWFRRNLRNFGDDDVLLNTGVSFPIAFDRASIYGFESKLEIPRWGKFSGYVSYSNLTGKGSLPVAGGLFLEDGSDALLHSNESFAITQDQRNTARARLRCQLVPRLWVAGSAGYASGLPVELEGPVNRALLVQLYGAAVVDRVNLNRGRVRPSFSADAGAGADVWVREKRSLRLQVDVINLTNRLNVINFAGLLSGTALAAPRSVAARLQMEW